MAAMHILKEVRAMEKDVCLYYHGKLYRGKTDSSLIMQKQRHPLTKVGLHIAFGDRSLTSTLFLIWWQMAA